MTYVKNYGKKKSKEMFSNSDIRNGIPSENSDFVRKLPYKEWYYVRKLLYS